MKFSLAVLTAIALAQAATVPSAPWTTLTPSATYAEATTDHTHLFGIQIVTLADSSATASSTAVAKRAVVNQITDGQIQNQSASSTSKKATTTASVVNQIGDGQIQNQTAKTSSTSKKATTTASVVNQIGDGQIQNQTAKTSSTSKKATTTASVVNQIGDGQIQNQTAKRSSAAATASVVNQISDGQIQHQTSTATTKSVANQISDGQVQASATSSSDEDTEEDYDGDFPISCKTTDSLAMTLNSSVLTDSAGRIGAIVANRQFQFDGPPPQAGSIYAAGWSITDDGYLALGDSKTFYQCKSGDFYNLYDENIAPQCEAVYLEVVDLVEC